MDVIGTFFFNFKSFGIDEAKSNKIMEWPFGESVEVASESLIAQFEENGPHQKQLLAFAASYQF